MHLLHLALPLAATLSLVAPGAVAAAADGPQFPSLDAAAAPGLSRAEVNAERLQPPSLVQAGGYSSAEGETSVGIAPSAVPARTRDEVLGESAMVTPSRPVLSAPQ